MATHHVKNADLREAIIVSKEQDELTKEALDMLILMAEKFANKLTYIYPEDREDCISFAVMDCYQYWRGYDPEKSKNAFAYYTQIIKNGFAKGWRKLYANMPKSSKISISYHQIYNL
jgi:DNA-directed RNA polymerase specialized sigma subunit